MQADQLILRNERPSDYAAVEELTREAFWNHFGPGCDEHYLIHILRGDVSFVPELDVVAELDGHLAGHIAYTKAAIRCDGGGEFEVLSFGPLSVHPSHQRQGIGRRLVEFTRLRAAELGYPAVLIYGDPAYYGRLGFVPAQTFGIGTCDGFYAPPLQALELVPGALSGRAGCFCEAPVYEMDQEAAKRFDQRFPEREKRTGLPTQLRFQELVSQRTPRR